MGLEDPSASGYGAMWAALDEKGKITHTPVRLPLAGGGAATAIAIEGGAGAPRAVVARGSADGIALDAVTLGSVPAASALLTLDGPPSLDVALLLDEGVLYFNDDGPDASDKRARRARIDWTAK